MHSILFQSSKKTDGVERNYEIVCAVASHKTWHGTVLREHNKKYFSDGFLFLMQTVDRGAERDLECF